MSKDPLRYVMVPVFRFLPLNPIETTKSMQNTYRNRTKTVLQQNISMQRQRYKV